MLDENTWKINLEMLTPKANSCKLPPFLKKVELTW